MKSTIIVAAMVALGAAPALAQTAQPAPAPQPQDQTQGQTQQTTITSVTFVDVSDLPAEARERVQQIEAQRGEQQLESLRESLKASPALLDALEREGATPSDVVAASLSQAGALTIVTRKET